MNDISENAKQFLPVILKSQEELSDYLRETLLKLIQTANQDIYSLFFPNAIETGFKKNTVIWFDEWAVRYVSMIIALSQSNPDIAKRIRSASYKGIQQWVELNRTNAGRTIYANYLYHRLILPHSTLERCQYFNVVVECITQKDYITLTKAVSAVNSLVPAQLVIEALQALDFSDYSKVIIAWQEEGSFTREHPDWNLLYLLEHYPWLDDYQTDVFKPMIAKDIETAIASKPDQVTAWLESPTGPRKYGLLNPEV